MQAATVPELLDSRLTLEHPGLEPNVVRTAAVAAGLITQLCPTLCNPMDCSPPGSSVHGMFQARILEWVAISSSRKSSQPRDRTSLQP